jgi:hypothetical protein
MFLLNLYEKRKGIDKAIIKKPTFAITLYKQKNTIITTKKQ